MAKDMLSLDHRRPLWRLVAVIAAGAVSLASLLPRAAAVPPASVYPEMVDKSIVDTIDKGLNYLARTQRPDGQWFPSGGYGSYPTVMTALAGMAFIAGGSTPESGPYAKNVRKAMFYIMRVAESEGDGLLANRSEGRSMHTHGFALLFLAQCFGSDLDEKTEARLRKILDKAVEITARSQSKATADAGGWIYSPEGNGDEGSVTVTQLQALRACRNVGIKVPKVTIDKAVKYLKICQNADGGISYSYSSRGYSRPPISAAGIACFYSAGVYDRDTGGQGVEAEMVAKLIKFCQGKINVEGSGDIGGHYFYAHMYWAEALYQRGGEDWKNYYPKMAKKLISIQSPDGSWQGDSVGTTYGTAISLMILQLPYGYLPICQR